LTLALLGVPLDAILIGTLADPVTFQPHRATDLVSAAVVSSVCEPLVRMGGDGDRPQAALATTWATADSRTWTFTLRRDVRFHDGAPFDADAVVMNIEHLRRVRGFPGRAERLGPYSVAIALERKSSVLLATLSQPFFAMQSPAALADGDTPVGTGAFRFGSRRAGEIELLANAEHWSGPPRVGRLVFRRFPSEDALVQALLAGRIDVTAAVGQDRVGDVRHAPGLTLDSKTGLNLTFLSLNNERAPLSDTRVRQAIARALDRDALVKLTLGGHGEPAKNPLPPSLPGYHASSKELRLDRAAAVQLLRAAGFADGFATTLLAVTTPRPYLPKPMRVIERVRQDLEQVGIRARLVPVASWGEYVERTTSGQYDAAVLGWQADSPDPNDFLTALIGSESIGATNRSRYRSEAMDALLKRGRLLSGPQERALAYKEAQGLFQRAMPIVPLYHVSVFTAYSKTLRGLQIGPTGLLRLDKAWKTEG
jgi:peptide/nickel transport system substrate-binding protein